MRFAVKDEINHILKHIDAEFADNPSAEVKTRASDLRKLIEKFDGDTRIVTKEEFYAILNELNGKGKEAIDKLTAKASNHIALTCLDWVEHG